MIPSKVDLEKMNKSITDRLDVLIKINMAAASLLSIVAADAAGPNNPMGKDSIDMVLDGVYDVLASAKKDVVRLGI
jgi:hypothetical protein